MNVFVWMSINGTYYKGFVLILMPDFWPKRFRSMQSKAINLSKLQISVGVNNYSACFSLGFHVYKVISINWYISKGLLYASFEKTNHIWFKGQQCEKFY